VSDNVEKRFKTGEGDNDDVNDHRQIDDSLRNIRCQEFYF
jgi:hypothetical protein